MWRDADCPIAKLRILKPYLEQIDARTLTNIVGRIPGITGLTLPNSADFFRSEKSRPLTFLANAFQTQAISVKHIPVSRIIPFSISAQAHTVVVYPVPDDVHNVPRHFAAYIGRTTPGHRGCRLIARTQYPIHLYTLLTDKPYGRRITSLEFEVRNSILICLTSTIHTLRSFSAEFPRLKQATAKVTITEVDDFSQWGDVDVRAWALQVRDGIDNMLTTLKRALASTKIHRLLQLQLALTYEITTMYVSSDFIKDALHFLTSEGSYQLESGHTATEVMLLPNYIP